MSNRRRMTDEEFAELRALANEHCEQIVTAYLGQPLKRTRREVRWGEKTGSFVLVISGRKRGSWYEHNGGGGMLEFLRQQHGGDWGRGIDAAIQFTGYAPPSWNDNGLSDEAIRALVESAKRRAEERAREQAKAHAGTTSQGAGAYAARIYREAKPIAGTLAERYVRDIRFGGHDLPIPKELRFHPAVWCGETKASSGNNRLD
jgi:hypothetical protein